MWQRFTERARKVVFYAQEEAQKFGEGYVSTEHLLLGLVREPDCVAVKALLLMSIDPSVVRLEVEKQLPRGDARPTQDMTLTPRAKRVIDLAYDEARNLNNNYIGTEHLLLGLIREGDGLAGRVLAKLGVELVATRQIAETLQAANPTKPNADPPRAGSTSFRTSDDELERSLLRAQRLAARMGNATVAVGHWLLAASRAPSLAQELKNQGVDVETLRSILKDVVLARRGSGPPDTIMFEHRITSALSTARTRKNADPIGCIELFDLLMMDTPAYAIALGRAGYSMESE